MEESKRRIISENLSELVKQTRVNATFMVLMETSGTFATYDTEEIRKIGNEVQKATDMYNLMTSRAKGFEFLLEALEYTMQSGALSLLCNAWPKDDNTEELGKERILKNMVKLMEETRICSQFLHILQANGIFSVCDVADVNAEPHEMEKSHTMYKIILTRTNGYKTVVEALKGTQQREPLSILVGVEPPPSASIQRDANSLGSRRGDLVVGDKECNFNKVTLAMSRSPTFSTLDYSWKDLAIRLDTSTLLTNNLKQQKLLGSIGLCMLVEKLLVEWVGRIGNKATLEALINHLRDANMNCLAGTLKEEFKL